MSCGCSHPVCHQLWVQRCPSSHSLSIQRSTDLLIYYLHWQRATEAPARPAIATKPLLTGKMGWRHQRYLPSLPYCRLCFLVLPYRTQRWRRKLACGIQLGYRHILGHLRSCWHLLFTGRWKAIHCASITGEGGVTRRRHPTCGSVAWARSNVVMEVFGDTEDRVYCFEHEATVAHKC
jgi:hypothetical protein